jgi:lysophospholipase L1-like esterase
MTPTPVHVPWRLQYQLDTYEQAATGVAERTDKRAREYGLAVLRVAQRTNVIAVDLWSLMHANSAGRTTEFLNMDGLHLSPTGQEFVFAALMDNLPTSALPDNLTLDFPMGKDMDASDPANCIASHISRFPL